MHGVGGNWLTRFAPPEFHGAEPLHNDFTLFPCTRNKSDVCSTDFVSKISLDPACLVESVGKSVKDGGIDHVMMVTFVHASMMMDSPHFFRF
jgi:hypothetical protein